MKDNEITRLFLERSEQAIAKLDAKYGAVIRRVSSNILKDPQDVEECVNDTYLRIWSIVPPQHPEHIGVFSCRIARNISLNRHRFNSADKRNSYYDAALDELAGCISVPNSVESEVEAKELAACINTFLGTLSLGDRRLFMQRYWLGSDISQIAKSENISSHAVSVRLFRIRKKLKKYLDEEGVIA